MSSKKLESAFGNEVPKRVKKILILLTEEEQELFRNVAEQLGWSVSMLMRVATRASIQMLQNDYENNNYVEFDAAWDDAISASTDARRRNGA